MDLLDKIGLHFFGWFFPSMSVTCAALLWLVWKRGNASMSWPIASGEILDSSVEFNDGSYLPRIRYRYWGEETEYCGDVLTYRGYSADRHTAEAFVARYPAGAAMSVRYDPNAPGTAVLEPGIDRKVYLRAVVVLMVLFFAGIGAKIAALLQ
jgi:hypothetical protein